MAVWQSTLYLVPRPEVLSLFQTVPAFMDAKWFYENKWNRKFKSAIYEKAFDLILPRQNDSNASNDVLSWGTIGDNEIDMRFEDKKPAVLSVRINANRINMNFVSSIVDFASKNDLLFWASENQTFIEPVLETFLEKFRLSRALLFAKNATIFSGDKKYFDAFEKEILKKFKSGNSF